MIQYVNTIVFEWQEDGYIRLDTGGWNSMTTKKWMQYGMDKVEPGRFRIFQKNFVWYVEDLQS